MGDFKNGIWMKTFTSIIAVMIIAINVFFVATYAGDKLPNLWYAYLGIGVAAVIYFCFIAYLAIYLLICLGWESLAQKSFVQKIYRVESFLEENRHKTITNGDITRCA